MNFPSQIGQFTRYTAEPNTISDGALYTAEISVPVLNPYQKRSVRIYLPSNYDPSNPDVRFPVLYMTDGKNLFDHYTSFVGEWHMDERIEERMSKGKRGFIVVGIDSAPTDEGRTFELMAPSGAYHRWIEKRGLFGYANILSDYIFEVLKPLIDNTFYTLTDRKNTGIGGSSMGGLFSFYTGCKHKDKVSFVLSFSPAFFFYPKEVFMTNLSKLGVPNGYPKFLFTMGGDQLDSQLYPRAKQVHQYMVKHGFGPDQVRFIHDTSAVHNEDSWAEYIHIALDYWDKE